MFRPGDNGFQKSTLTNDDFWPDLALDEFQRERSIPPTINEKPWCKPCLPPLPRLTPR